MQKNTKATLLRTYFWFLSVQKIFKKQLILIETETNNAYLFFSFILIIFSVFDIFINPIAYYTEKKIINYPNSFQFYKSSKTQNLKVINIAKFYTNQQSFLILNYYSKKSFLIKNTKLNNLPKKIQLSNYNIKKNKLIKNKISLLKFKIDPLPICLDLKLNLLTQNSTFLFVKEYPYWKTKKFKRKNKKTFFLDSFKFNFPKYNAQFYKQKNQVFDIHPYNNFLFSKTLYTDPFQLIYYNCGFQRFPTHLKTYSTNGFVPNNKFLFIQQNIRKSPIFSYSKFTKKPNIFKKNFNDNDTVFKQIFYSPVEAFLDKRETINSKSFLLFFQFGFFIFFYKIFQNLYKDYGKEILITFLDLIKTIGILEDDEWIKDDLNLIKDKKAFRSIKKITTRLRDIAGIDHLILDISEIIWFLRSQPKTLGINFFDLNLFKKYFLNKSKKLTLSSDPIFLNSKAFLFVGPPGTGKTLLVQAIAGESEVPILIQSGSILKNPRQRGKGARTIQKLFQRARRIAPCIIFIDEVDGIGARREHLSRNVTGNHDLLEIIDTNSLPFLDDPQNEKYQQYFDDPLEESDNLENSDFTDDPQQKVSLKVLQENEFENISRTEQLSLLTQLLIELDGLKPLNNIIVIGATNRFSILDPALLRPGRFNSFLYLSLPNQQKRVELFKLYSQRLGFSSEILWPYFSRRTEELSSADIAAIVNESAIIAISRNQKHTIESLEMGIDRITTTPSRKLFYTIDNENKLFLYKYFLFYKIFYKTFKSSFATGIQNHYNNFYGIFDPIGDKSTDEWQNHQLNLRSYGLSNEYQNLQLQLKNSYYSISKSLFSIFFKNTPAVCLLNFFTRKPNFRYNSINNIINLLETKLISRVEIETKLVYLISGKAAELLPNSLPLIKTSKFKKTTVSIKFLFQLYEQSNFGFIDLKQCTLLSKFMINKWYFYAEQIVTEKYHWITRSYNQLELDADEIRLFKAIAEEMNYQIDQQNNFFYLSQKWSFRSWWQQSIQKKFYFLDRSVLNWYRIYLSDPEESEQNIEWVPPDDFYHTEQISQINPYFYWNNFLLYTQDYLYHSLILNTFNLSFRTIKNFTELLDLTADSLMRFLKIRDDQLMKIIKIFLEYQKKLSIESSSAYTDKLWKNPQLKESKSDPNKEVVLVNNWGKYSRRKKSKKLFLQKLNKIKKP